MSVLVRSGVRDVAIEGEGQIAGREVEDERRKVI